MKSLLKKITNQTLKYQLLWQSLKTKNLAYGTKWTASLPQSAPYRPPLSLNGIPATLARFQCLAITESQHRLVPCASPPWTLLPTSLPLISHLQVLFWTPLSWQVPPVLSDLSNTHDSIIAMIYIYVTVCLVSPTRLQTGESRNHAWFCLPLSTEGLAYLLSTRDIQSTWLNILCT